MVERSNRWLGLLLMGAGLLFSALIGLHLVYPLPYVAKVLVYGNEGFPAGYERPASSVAKSERPRPLPRAIDARVNDLLVQFDGIDDTAQFLDASGTTSLLVMAGGQLVSEYYRRDHNAQSRVATYSVSKAVLSALVGVAINEGLLASDAPVTRYAPELSASDERFDDILVQDLLDMRSGIAYTPGIRFPFVNADDALLYYHHDVASILTERMSIAESPGDFQYNHYNSALLGLVLRRATGTSVAQYLQRNLWTPLGAVSPAYWTTDACGFEMMGSGLHATPADLARIGQLYLREGRVDGRQLLQESWTDLTSAAVRESKRDSGPRAYHNGWWLVPRREGSSDFSATGSYGQYLYVSPQFDVVIVRTGVSRGGWNDDEWLALFVFIAEQL